MVPTFSISPSTHIIIIFPLSKIVTSGKYYDPFILRLTLISSPISFPVESIF
jgi:hypothetical protein